VHPDAVLIGNVTLGPEASVWPGAVVSGGVEVPARALALGVPARIRPDAVDPDRMIRPGMLSYVERGARYRKLLRRLDSPLVDTAPTRPAPDRCRSTGIGNPRRSVRPAVAG
jgi:carbonic anhydrase/acetyltransferase-like protein (isoleucine patch superfamily)